MPKSFLNRSAAARAGFQGVQVVLHNLPAADWDRGGRHIVCHPARVAGFRDEPGTGEINYPYLFRRLDELGCAGWIGRQYKPGAFTEAGLDWLAPYQSELREFPWS